MAASGPREDMLVVVVVASHVQARRGHPSSLSKNHCACLPSLSHLATCIGGMLKIFLRPFYGEGVQEAA